MQVDIKPEVCVFAHAFGFLFVLGFLIYSQLFDFLPDCFCSIQFQHSKTVFPKFKEKDKDVIIPCQIQQAEASVTGESACGEVRR